MEPFKISNMSPTAFNWISYLSASVFGLLGIFMFFFGLTKKIYFFNVAGLVSVMFAFVLPFVLMGLARTTVDFDGTTVTTSSIFKKREILLQDVKCISYEFETCYRSYNNAIHIDLDLNDNLTVTLTDMVPKEDTDRLVKGDHSFVPLLVMYDVIAEKYPDKVKNDNKVDE